jgi:hypothetical protein
VIDPTSKLVYINDKAENNIQVYALSNSYVKSDTASSKKNNDNNDDDDRPEHKPKDDCDDSYPDFCIKPYPPDLNCPDIGRNDFTVLKLDPHGFDRDNDGKGCDEDGNEPNEEPTLRGPRDNRTGNSGPNDNLTGDVLQLGPGVAPPPTEELEQDGPSSDGYKQESGSSNANNEDTNVNTSVIDKKIVDSNQDEESENVHNSVDAEDKSVDSDDNS